MDAAPIELGLTAEDHGFRRAAEAYFEEKGKLAHSSFDAKLLAVFRSFEEHWRGFFAPPHEPALSEYLVTPIELRQAQFDRFKRECRSWEVSFRHCSRPSAGNPGSAGGGTDWSDLKRRIDEHRLRQEEVRSYYADLGNRFQGGGGPGGKRSHPIELLGHLRALGVAQDASLDEIKKQYKRLAKVHHPDRNGDAVRMSRINDAYRAILQFYRVA